MAEIGVAIPSPQGESTSLSEPYTVADIVSILDWVNGGTSPYMKESRALFVACGLGAGVSAQEMDSLTWDQVDYSDEAVVLRDVNGRDIPVFNYFANPFREFHRHNDEFLFHPHLPNKRKESSRMAIGRSDVCYAVGLKPLTIRMSDMWIHMIGKVGGSSTSCDRRHWS